MPAVVLEKLVIWIREELMTEEIEQSWFARYCNDHYSTLILTLRWMLGKLFLSLKTAAALGNNYAAVVNEMYELAISILSIIFKHVPRFVHQRERPIQRIVYEEQAKRLITFLKQLLQLSNVVQKVYRGLPALLRPNQAGMDDTWPPPQKVPPS